MKMLKSMVLCSVLSSHAMHQKQVSFKRPLTQSQGDLIKREMAIFEQKKPNWYELDYDAYALVINNKKINRVYNSYAYEGQGTLVEFNAVVDSQVSKEIK